MNLFLLAQAPAAGAIASWAIWGVVIVGVLAVLFAFIQHSGIAIPPLFVRVFWIVIAVAFAIFAIKLIMSIM